MAKIMNLVDPRQMERYEPVNPLHRTMGHLDQEMESILHRSDLNDREKVQKYNQILQRFLEYSGKEREPTSTPPPPSNPLLEQQAIDLAPKALKKKAIALMQRIKDHPEMGWTETGEFVYRGRTIPRSNIIDLIGDMLRARRSVEPEGWREFARIMGETNIPRELVGHERRWRYMQGDSTDDYSTADEGSPVQTRASRSKIKQTRTPRPRSRTPRSKTPRRSPLIKKEIKMDWDSLYKA